MRVSLLLSAFAVTLSIAGSPAPLRGQAVPTADEIIARYVQRVGGVKRLHAVQSVRRHGKYYSGGGFEAVVTNDFERWIRIELPKINKMLENRGLRRIDSRVSP